MDTVYNINIERAVLSSILFSPEIIEDVLGVLKPSDFYLPAHQKIFSVMQILHNEDLPIDEEFIRTKIKQSKSSMDKEFRGNSSNFDESILIEILSANPISNTAAYIEQIKDSAVKRELATLANNIKKVAIEDELPSSEALDFVQNELYKISVNSANSELKNMQEIASETINYIKKMKEMGNKYLTGETTGFDDLDRRTTGFNGGDLVIVAARPAMGKTAFTLNMALKNVENGKGVIIFSLEMPSEQLMLRLLSAKTSIPLQNLRKGDLDDIQWSRLTSALEELRTKKLFVDDGGSVNINQLRARVRKLASNPDNKISMVIIDYLQLMTGSGAGKDRHLEVSEISRGLKMLARELKIPVIALSQLNRGLENRPDKRPMLSDLRESGAIEQDADIIMFVYRDDVYREREEAKKEKEAKDKGVEYKSAFVNKPEEEAEIIIGKQRNGPIGTVKLIFQKNYTRFVNATSRDSVPIETVFETMDSSHDTKIDMPDIL
ncbi:replicative DNA helicase [Arcobacter sp. FWKO B]|uniref:replicative DNA helicase n=1 Tax=Arcobacter sp. FWKO B TaxID=2593672 RepID=UPI0018A487CD|nr:replicative DNA helicase [Arcobacter sp. FWKO B]QOG11681.1 replicative DNA helicase [Arcobacter sp. FWKO B]